MPYDEQNVTENGIRKRLASRETFQKLIFATQPSKDQKWMEKFFSDLLFKEGGIYTACGSKPITEIVLYHYTNDEMTDILSKEDLENCHLDEEYDLPENWERWEKISPLFPLKRHLLFRSHFSEDKKISYIYFVDVIKTAILLEDNYELFRKELEIEFHPLNVVLEMPNANSVFWQKIKESKNKHLMWGILFGYGKVNASLFNWKYSNLSNAAKEFIDCLPTKFSNPSPTGQIRIFKTNFLLPSFISFVENDEIIRKYESERQMIKEKYNNHSILEITLNELVRPQNLAR